MPIQTRVEEDGTHVIINPKEPTREKIFKLKDLKSRGLSLFYGEEIGGESTYFLASEEYSEGDIIEAGEVSYRVEYVVEKLPKRSKVVATINDSGVIEIRLEMYNEEGEREEYMIYEAYADELIKRIATKNKLGGILESLREADLMSVLEKGECLGIGIDVKQTIPKYKRARRSAKKLFRDLPGEFRMKICDIESYYVYIKVPSLELLDVERAKSIDGLLGMFGRPE